MCYSTEEVSLSASSALCYSFCFRGYHTGDLNDCHQITAPGITTRVTPLRNRKNISLAISQIIGNLEGLKVHRLLNIAPDISGDP